MRGFVEGAVGGPCLVGRQAELGFGGSGGIPEISGALARLVGMDHVEGCAGLVVNVDVDKFTTDVTPGLARPIWGSSDPQGWICRDNSLPGGGRMDGLSDARS